MASVLTRSRLFPILGTLVLAGLCLPAAAADFELKDSQGRRILLKDDGTWRYLELPANSGPAAEPAIEQPQADLRLERRVDAPGGCRLDLVLINALNYEITSLVPEFTAYRGNEVAHSTQMIRFGPVRSGDQHHRGVQFAGIGCADIAKLEVSGGDRCEMGDLNKFSDARGQCLARLHVRPSALLRFEARK